MLDARAFASTRAAIERLWEVCQVPDYRKISPAAHAELVVNAAGPWAPLVGRMAGLDLLARADVTLAPGGGRALVPTGIAFALPEGFEGQVRPRSGLAAKHGVTVLNAPGTIDEGYRGEMECIIAKIFGSESQKEAAVELFMLRFPEATFKDSALKFFEGSRSSPGLSTCRAKCTPSPRLAATSWARSGRYSSRGPAISAGCAPSGSWDRAISTSASATVLAATIWVRILGR